MRLVIVSGLSGAGKTVALKQYEDLGYYSIDNLPLALIHPLSLHAVKHARYERLAIGIDARESPAQIARFPRYIERVRSRGAETHIVFLTARDEVILRRYSETRRKHPLTDDGLSVGEAIERERELLKPISALADVTLDTSELNLHELREAIRTRLPEAGPGRLSLVLVSFGFRNGVPEGADFVFDVRCLPNPHWEPSLRELDGRHPEVVAYLRRMGAVDQLGQDIIDFLRKWLPCFQNQDRAYVTVAIGCTGGQHRSVYLVERLAQTFQEDFDQVIIRHKELA